MNKKFPQVHKTEIISDHVLDFQSVKTDRVKRLMKEREELQQRVKQQKLAKQKPVPTLLFMQEKRLMLLLEMNI